MYCVLIRRKTVGRFLPYISCSSEFINASVQHESNPTDPNSKELSKNQNFIESLVYMNLNAVSNIQLRNTI